MSHQDSELELAEGVNVLIGPNNSGKSAVVSALQTLTELLDGSYMVRHGTNETQVVVETAEGDEIVWGRNNSSNYLTINGTKHTRLKNNREYFLEELHKILKLSKVKNKSDESVKFDIHFATQKEPIFLINEPASRAATFFAASSDAGRLLEIREKFKSKISEAKDTKKVLQIQLNSQNNELIRLNLLNLLDDKVALLKPIYDELNAEKTKIHTTTKLLNEWNVASKKHAYNFSKTSILLKLLSPPDMLPDGKLEIDVNALRAIQQKERERSLKYDILIKLQTPPQFEDTDTLQQIIHNIRSLIAIKERLEIRVEVLSQLLIPPEMTNQTPLTAAVQNIKRTQVTSLYLHKKLDILTPLKTTPALEPAQILKDKIKEIKRLIVQHAYNLNKHSILRELKVPPSIEDPLSLEIGIKTLATKHKIFHFLQRKMKVLEKLTPPPHIVIPIELKNFIGTYLKYEKQISLSRLALESATGSFMEWLKEHPTCPTCGNLFDEDHLVRGIHA